MDTPDVQCAVLIAAGKTAAELASVNSGTWMGHSGTARTPHHRSEDTIDRGKP
jgi:hypothetical protein